MGYNEDNQTFDYDITEIGIATKSTLGGFGVALSKLGIFLGVVIALLIVVVALKKGFKSRKK